MDANDTYNDRNATVTFTAGDLKQTVTITQKQKDALLVSSNKVELGKDGGNFSIQLQSNVSVSYEIEEAAKDWLSSLDSRSLSTHTLNFTAKANDKVERRQGNIVLKGEGGLTETVTVYQEGEEPSLVLTTASEMTVGSEGGVLKIELQSNLEDVQMELPALGWLRESSSRSVSSYTYYVEVDANDTYDDRNATVTFTAGSLKQTVTITQKQKDALIIGQDVYAVSAEGERFELSVSTNVDYEVKTSVEWIQRNVESRGLVENKITFTVAENTSSELRKGEIIIISSNGHLEQKIQIIQEGAFVPIVTINQREYELDASKQSIEIEITSNVEIEYELFDSWITLLGGSGERNSQGWYYVYKYIVASNNTPDIRTAIIRIKNDEYCFSENVIVRQNPITPIIAINQKVFEIDASQRTLEIEISSNIKFGFETSDNWITYVSTDRNVNSQGYDYVVRFAIDNNETPEVRIATIIVKNDCYGIRETIKVVQKPIIPYINISKKSFDFDYKGHDDKFEVRTNVEILFESSEEWVQVSNYQSEKNDDERIYYYRFWINENVLNRSRSATIKVFNENFKISDNVIINQARGNTGGNIDDMEEIEWK